MSTTTKPSEGAVRAAKTVYKRLIYQSDHVAFDQEDRNAIERTAELIDRETHAGEMLRLLELWDDMRLVEFDSNENTVLRLSPAKWHEVREVIRRARGGE